MEKVTIWYKYNRKKEWEHNHIEDGWNFGSIPTAKHDNQAKAWKAAKWKRAWGFLENGKVTEIVQSREEQQMGFITLLLVAVIVYAIVEKHRRERELDGWFEGLLDYISGVF